MEEFIQEFKAEASSIIQRLQEQVLLLEQEKENKSIVEEIFRGVHTLKGSSRMFGFENIERITHELETTFHQIREGTAKPTKAVIELSLSVVDMCAAILKGDHDQHQYTEILTKLGSKEVLLAEEEHGESVYQVLYYPKESVYERGVNPMAAIQELKDLGEHTLFTLKQPVSLEEQELAKKFESAFEIILTVRGSKELLEDVFLFMDQSEYGIYLLDNDKNSWQDAVDRAQKIAEIKFTTAEVDERYAALTPYFEKIKNKVEPEKIKPVEVARTVTKNTDSSLNFINVKLERLDEMMKLVSELVTIKAELNYQSSLLEDIKLTSLAERLEKVTTRFRDNAFNMRLVPLQVLSLKFQRMARDLGEKLGKDVNVLTEGLDTEIDKTIINEIEAPLMHIIRNAIDHGLEKTEERKKLGKNEKGLLKIVAFYAGAKRRIHPGAR